MTVWIRRWFVRIGLLPGCRAQNHWANRRRRLVPIDVVEALNDVVVDQTTQPWNRRRSLQQPSVVERDVGLLGRAEPAAG